MITYKFIEGKKNIISDMQGGGKKSDIERQIEILTEGQFRQISIDIKDLNIKTDRYRHKVFKYKDRQGDMGSQKRQINIQRDI